MAHDGLEREFNILNWLDGCVCTGRSRKIYKAQVWVDLHSWQVSRDDMISKAEQPIAPNGRRAPEIHLPPLGVL